MIDALVGSNDFGNLQINIKNALSNVNKADSNEKSRSKGPTLHDKDLLELLEKLKDMKFDTNNLNQKIGNVTSTGSQDTDKVNNAEKEPVKAFESSGKASVPNSLPPPPPPLPPLGSIPLPPGVKAKPEVPDNLKCIQVIKPKVPLLFLQVARIKLASITKNSIYTLVDYETAQKQINADTLEHFFSVKRGNSDIDGQQGLTDQSNDKNQQSAPVKSFLSQQRQRTVAICSRVFKSDPAELIRVVETLNCQDVKILQAMLAVLPEPGEIKIFDALSDKSQLVSEEDQFIYEIKDLIRPSIAIDMQIFAVEFEKRNRTLSGKLQSLIVASKWLRGKYIKW